MKKIKFITAVIFMLAMTPGVLRADDEGPYAEAVIYPVYQKSIQVDTLAERASVRIASAFSRAGRFIPVERGAAAEYINRVPDSAEGDPYLKAAAMMGANICVKIIVSYDGKFYYGNMSVIPMGDEYAFMKREIQVKSVVGPNIPLKLEREALLLHKGLKLTALYESSPEGIIIHAGQWHGLSAGEYTTDAGKVKILSSGRYRSAAITPSAVKDIAGEITFSLTPDFDSALKDIDRQLVLNASASYGLRGDSMSTPEQRFAEGLCVINPGANICVPVYGAYLSLGYMGLPDSDPSTAGLVAGLVFYSGQLLYVPASDRFTTNFFPWVDDPDRTGAKSNLHVFLWSALPFTLSSVYLDQAAYSFKKNGILPPFFTERDSAAAILSLLVPGGGLFYKGQRSGGWAFLSAELAAGSAAAYNYSSDNFRYYLAAALFVKAADIFSAWFADPAYTVFTDELAAGQVFPSFNISRETDKNAGAFFAAGVSMNF
jgi:hypothetical protein